MGKEREAQLAIEADKESLRSDIDEDYLKALIEQERRTRDVSLASLRKELESMSNEIKTMACHTDMWESMSTEMKTIACQIPNFEMLEKQQQDVETMCVSLREHFEILSLNMEQLMQQVATAPAIEIHSSVD